MDPILKELSVSSMTGGQVTPRDPLLAEMAGYKGTPEQPLGKSAQYKIGVEGLPQAVQDVAGDFNPLTQMSVGAKALWDSAAYALKQKLGMKLSPEEQATKAANDALLTASTPAQAGNIMSSLATVPIGNAVLNAGPLASGLQRLPYLGPLITGGVVGGATAASTGGDVDRGVAGGAIGGAIASAASKLIAPITQNPNVQKLLNYEVVPTPGSAAGGFAKAMEDKAQSIPVIGDIIKSANQRGRQELSKAAIKLSTPPGEQVSNVGAEAIPEMKQAFSSAYGKVYQNSQIGIDRQLLQDLAAAKNAPIVPMSSDEVRKFDHVIQTQILDRFPGAGNKLATSDAKAVVEANLGKAVSEAPPNSPLQKALRAARDSFRGAMARSVGAASADLPAINKAYSNFADLKGAIETADKTPGPLSGLPTPRQLLNVTKPGELNDLARAANKVMPATVPNSGTTDRYLAALLLGGLGTAASTTQGYQSVPYLNSLGPKFWLTLGAAPLLYSRAGSRYLLGDLPGQQAAAAQLGALTPYSAAALSQYVNQPR